MMSKDELTRKLEQCGKNYKKMLALIEANTSNNEEFLIAATFFVPWRVLLRDESLKKYVTKKSYNLNAIAGVDTIRLPLYWVIWLAPATNVDHAIANLKIFNHDDQILDLTLLDKANPEYDMTYDKCLEFKAKLKQNFKVKE